MTVNVIDFIIKRENEQLFEEDFEELLGPNTAKESKKKPFFLNVSNRHQAILL